MGLEMFDSMQRQVRGPAQFAIEVVYGRDHTVRL